MGDAGGVLRSCVLALMIHQAASRPWLGMALCLSGRLVLYGNVVAVNGRVLVWLGEKGVGKSILTAVFVVAGYLLLRFVNELFFVGFLSFFY